MRVTRRRDGKMADFPDLVIGVSIPACGSAHVCHY